MDDNAVTDPYRYLPCRLHPALEIPAWFDYERVVSADDKTGPFCCHYIGPKGEDEDLDEDDIDMCRVIALDHPAGWDHAVRAYVAICGGTVPESACCRFAWTDAAEGWSVDIEYGEDVPGRMVHLTNPNAWDTPAGRREALCRCICAALGVGVGAVFPVEQA